MDRVENHGIIFIDEIDKIAGERATTGPDVSREGVQRDLLPIVEGSTVQTRYGRSAPIISCSLPPGPSMCANPRTSSLSCRDGSRSGLNSPRSAEADFVRIMTEPENALTKQYQALVAAEGAELEFTAEGIAEVARIAALANDRMENIGARRLHTVMASLMEDLLFDLPDQMSGKTVMDGAGVRERLARVVNDDDLRRYIL